MLQAPTNDRKTKADASAKTAERLPEQEQSLQLLGGLGQARQSQPLQQRNNLAGLQKAYGNQAVLRMKGRSPVANSVQGGVLQRKCACGNVSGAAGTCAECQGKQALSLQTKLRINEPGDRYEQEADRVAEQVMRMPDRPSNNHGLSFSSVDASIAQRKCTACEEEKLQRKDSGSTAETPATVPPVVHEVLRSPGQPLDPATRAFMEPRFGHDFSRVRVHSGGAAEQSAREVNASAYTVGHNMVFGAGRFAPGTHEGRRLIAHELTHVVQQEGSAAPVLRRDDTPPLMKPAPGTVPADTLSLIQVRWSKLKGAVAKFPLLKEWIGKGDAVIALMLNHDIGYSRAIGAGDAQLAAFYKLLLQGELVAYEYASWHAYVYRNWLRLQAPFDSLVRSFDADKRHFAGKQDAEDKVRVIKKLIDSVGNLSARTLRGLVVDHPYTFRSGVIITVTSAADKKNRAALEQVNRNLREIDLAVAFMIEDINKFLWSATKEGFWQAVEAIKEYYEVRRGILDDGGGPDVDDKSNQPSSQSQTGSGAGTGSGSGTGTGSGSGTGTGSGSGTAVTTMPNCGKRPTDTPKKTIVPEKGFYKGKKITYQDKRRKHTKVADCKVSQLVAAKGIHPDQLEGELKAFVKACNDKDRAYGSQLGKEGYSNYEALMKVWLEALPEVKDPDMRIPATDGDLGLRIGNTGCNVTKKYQVHTDPPDDPESQFHLFPAV